MREKKTGERLVVLPILWEKDESSDFKVRGEECEELTIEGIKLHSQSSQLQRALNEKHIA